MQETETIELKKSLAELSEGLVSIPDKPNNRNQKYRLTEKGQALFR
jgi:predicted transcriptional regulator